MNTIGKIFVVFITACSVGFLAFVAALRSGGPDWQAEMRSDDLSKEVVFSTEAGERTMYSAKHRRTESNIGEKTPIMAKVVVDARKRLEDEANKKQQELSPQPQQWEELLKPRTELIPIDKVGVETREALFADRLQKLWQEIEATGDKFSLKTIETQGVLSVVQERREEAYRLTNQLESLRNDRFAALEQQKVLEGELVRLDENRRRLERRQNQLKQQVGSYE